MSGRKSRPRLAAILATALRRFQVRPAACKPNPAETSKAAIPSPQPRSEKMECLIAAVLVALDDIGFRADNGFPRQGHDVEVAEARRIAREAAQ
jgi:hypothetical protein